jgi:integrase
LAIVDPQALELAPEIRLNAERAKLFVDHLAETNIPRSMAIQVDALYKAARIMMPGVDWTWLKKMKARLYAAAPAQRAIGPVITSVWVLELGLKLMDETLPRSGYPIRLADAVRYRDGLMIALLAYAPVRRKNIAAIRIGRELIRDSDRWFLVFSSRATKTGTPLEFEIPELLQPYLERYLKVVRQRLLGSKASKALWISWKRRDLSYSAAGEVISRHSSRRLGIRITSHDARDAGATTWAIAAPGHIGVARDLLGHADLRTTQKYYNRSKGIEASRTHAKVIADIRGRS